MLVGAVCVLRCQGLLDSWACALVLRSFCARFGCACVLLWVALVARCGAVGQVVLCLVVLCLVVLCLVRYILVARTRRCVALCGAFGGGMV